MHVTLMSRLGPISDFPGLAPSAGASGGRGLLGKDVLQVLQL